MSRAPQTPHQIYTERRDAYRARAEGHATTSRALSRLRLAAAAVTLVLAWLAWESGVISPWWIVAPVGVFLVLARIHDRILAAERGANRARAFYDKGLDRLEHRWMGGGDTGEGFFDSRHPYAADLDLYGRGSVFELLCTTRSAWGSRVLASWLRDADGVGDVRRRQVAVQELGPGLDLREHLAVLGEDAVVHDPDSLTRWALRPVLLDASWVRMAAFFLAAATALAVGSWLAGWVDRTPVVLVLLGELSLALPFRSRVREVIESLEEPRRELRLLRELVEVWESKTVVAERLRELTAFLRGDGESLSKRLARLERRMDVLDARRNKLFAPVAPLLLWSTQFAFLLESWRKRLGKDIARALEVVSELDALSALATYSFEHPEDPYPELMEESAETDEVSEAPLLEARGLGHPLIPLERLVRNDLRLGGELRLLVVSGSNMSGKSTLLRAVGTNVALALAGAPVRAHRMRVSRVVVGASIRVHDSLQEGVSRFYAEIQRLRQIMDLASGPRPLLFLLDEILHGTNSHDRRIGAEAVVRGLVERGAVGLITTHDLALSRVAEALAPRGANVHFQDHLEDGKVVFDYRMRAGVVQKSNALDLMRSVGLDV